MEEEGSGAREGVSDFIIYLSPTVKINVLQKIPIVRKVQESQFLVTTNKYSSQHQPQGPLDTT